MQRFAERGRGWLCSVVRQHWGLLLVLVVALGFRVAYLSWFRAFPGGDVFNFITIAQGLPQGLYAVNEKRLPFYPLLLLLAHAVLDWEAAGLVIAVGASLLSLVALYAVGRTLGLSRTALAVALLLYQAYTPFFLSSVRAYADTTFIAAALLGVLGVLRARTAQGALATGLALGAAALTRYEGGAVAAALLPYWLLFPRGRQRRLVLIAAAVFLASLIPYGALALRNHRPLVGAGYFAEAATEANRGTPGVQPFLNNVLLLWHRTALLGAWNVPASLTREAAADPFGLGRTIAQRASEPSDALLLFTAAGAVILIVRRRWWEGGLLGAFAVATTAPAAWYQPLERYDAFLFPVTLLLFGSTLTAFQQLVAAGTTGRAGRALRLLAGCTLLGVTTGLWLPHAAGRIRDRQLKHFGRNYAFYRAIHAARALPGTIAFATDADIVKIYFGSRAAFVELPRSPESATGFAARLRAAGAAAIVLPETAIVSDALRADHGVTVQNFSTREGSGETNRAAVFRL